MSPRVRSPILADLTGLERSQVPGVRLRYVIDAQSDRVTRLAWSPDGDRLAVPSRDGGLRLHDGRTGELVEALDGHCGGVMGVAWSPDGRRLASIGAEGQLCIWDTGGDLRSPETIRPAEGSLTGVAWSPDGHMLVVTSEAGYVLRWRVGEGHEREPSQLVAERPLASPGALHASWSPDGHLLAVGSRAGAVHVWDPWSAEQCHELVGHTDASVITAWSPDGSRIGSGAKDGTVRIWDPGTGAYTRIGAHGHEVRAIAWHPGGSLLATKSSDGWVRLLRPGPWRTVAALAEIGAPVGWSTGLAFHPCLPLLATLGAGDRVVRVWTVETDRLPRHRVNPESLRATPATCVPPRPSRRRVVLL